MMTTTPRSSSRLLRAPRIIAIACAFITVTAAAAGAQGAAPASPASLDAILKQLATYDGGIASEAAWQLRDYVYARKDDAAGRAECETKLLAFLKTPAAHSGKMAAVRLLRMIAGDSAIPALQALLADPKASDYAIYVLQPMPGSAPEAALVQALKTARGGPKAALVVALGQRRAASALPLLEPMLRDPVLGKTAAVAIGRIGGPAAAKALGTAYSAASGESKRLLAASMLEAADGLLAAKETDAARSVFDTLAADRSLPAAIRQAALMGNISVAGSTSAGLLVEMLGSSDADARDAAIARIGDVIPPDGIAPVCDLLPRLPEPAQIQVLAALVHYPAGRVRSTVTQAARSDSPEVRAAALKALGSVGDASSVPYLVDVAASAPKGPVQGAARSALYGLPGREVDDAIAAALKQPASDAVSAELLKAVADRRIFLAKTAVSASVTAPSTAVRIEALKTLRAIGSPSDASPVLDLLLKSGDDVEQAEAEKTVSALLQKTATTDGRSRLVRTRLFTEKDPAARARLIALLPPTADGAALPMLRTALKDQNAEVADAAARAIAAWPTPTARDDMLVLVKDSKDETHRLLALASLIRLVGLDPYRKPEAAVAELKMLSGLAWRPEEQRLVLGTLASFPCPDATEMARGFLQNDALKAEAQAAIDKMASRRPGGDRR